MASRRAILATVAYSAIHSCAFAATPLNDLGSGLYLSQYQGGLYPGGLNEAPAAHAAEGLARAFAVQPLNTAGQPDANGKYGFVSISYSNGTQEFCSHSGLAPCNSWTFMGQAAVDPHVNHTQLALVNGAKGGQAIGSWDQPTDSNYNRIITEWLTPNGLSEQQIQAAWVKLNYARPTISLPDPSAEAFQVVAGLGDVVRTLKNRYPNLQQVFFSSRIYAGYATTELHPEPYAYEAGFAVKWLIEAQINQMAGGSIDPLAGDLNYATGIAPWLAWGPYLWADGTNPRSDGLTWTQQDFQNDGTHPATSAERKVGTMLLDFMLNSPYTQPWFLALPGDFNHDLVVDVADYVHWLKNGGTTPQYELWRANFGNTVDGGSAFGMAVPEPMAYSLLPLAAICGVSLRPRRLLPPQRVLTPQIETEKLGVSASPRHRRVLYCVVVALH
jgi:hypothetical protein